MTVEQHVLSYFRVLDASLDELSKQFEGELTGLPSWAHTARKITIGIYKEKNSVCIRVTPDKSIDADVVDVVNVGSKQELDQLLAPCVVVHDDSIRSGTFEFLPPNIFRSGSNYVDVSEPTYKLPMVLDENFFLFLGDYFVVTENQLLPPLLDTRCLIGYGTEVGILAALSVDCAKKESIEFWNKRKFPIQPKSYVRETNNILSRFENVIRRKAFLERRIHRFIDQHRHILLPSNKRCLFEHRLYLGEEYRVADFILEREQGLPPLLIELESPVHRIFTKKLELTAPASHARGQISEWVSFIDSDAAKNASNDCSFLAGPKERLVIIGRGTEHRENLVNTKFDGTTFWTYDILIEETRRRLNDQYASQCRMLGLPEKHPF